MANDSLNIESAWNSVALEERLTLLSQVQSQGLLAASFSFLTVATIAYGLDEIMLLFLALSAGLIAAPTFMNYSWRKEKPKIILQYLAARTVARRYAFAYNFHNLDLELIYRGRMQEIFPDKEKEFSSNQKHSIELDSSIENEPAVWICLFKAGLVIISEKAGGAKLEFLTTFNEEVHCRKARQDENSDNDAVFIQGSQVSRGRKIIISSDSHGAQYVLERKINQFLAN